MLHAKPPDVHGSAVYPSVDYPRVDSGIGDELALRAALDPAWDAVLRAWIDGHDRYPQPFRNRRPLS